MKSALAIAVREELEYTDDTGPACCQCKHCVSDDPETVDDPLSHCTLLAETLGLFIVSPQGRCKQFVKRFN